MAKKKVVKKIKLQIPAGKASPAPPIGPALGAAGLNIMGFCKEFNARTQDKAGELLPVEITVYHDKSFDFITKQPPVAQMILKAAGISKGSGEPNKSKVGKLTIAQIKEIVEKKKPDMRVRSEEAAICLVKGTARSIGIDIAGEE